MKKYLVVSEYENQIHVRIDKYPSSLSDDFCRKSIKDTTTNLMYIINYDVFVLTL